MLVSLSQPLRYATRAVAAALVLACVMAGTAPAATAVPAPAGWPQPTVVIDVSGNCPAAYQAWATAAATDVVQFVSPGTVACTTFPNRSLTASVDLLTRGEASATFGTVSLGIAPSGARVSFGITTGYQVWRTLNPDGSADFNGGEAATGDPGTASPTPPPSPSATPTPTATATPTTTVTATTTTTATATATAAATTVTLDPDQYGVLGIGLALVLAVVAGHFVSSWRRS